MTRGRRFDDEPKLNMKKVFVTILAVIVLILVIVSINNIFKKEKLTQEVSVEPTYFTVYENGKYGVIDNLGRYIITPTYEEMIVIPENTKPLFICTYGVNYETKEYKTKILNEKNQEILKEYDSVKPIENLNGSNSWYEHNILIYEKDGLKGLIQFDGNKITEPIYNSVYTLDGIEKTIIVEKDGLKGIVNTEFGSLIAEAKYQEITTLAKNNSNSGYIVKENGKYGIISGNGKVVFEPKFKEVAQVSANELYVVNPGDGFKVVNSIEEVILDKNFDKVLEINGDNLVIEKDKKIGVVNKAGETKIPNEYDELVFAQDVYYIAKKDSKYGIISVENEVKVDFKYESIIKADSTSFYQCEKDNLKTDVINQNFETKLSNIIISELNVENGYLRIRDGGNYKFYNFNFEEKNNKEILKTRTLFLKKDKNGKYGYVNKNDELIVDYKYDDAKEQNQYGYCAVKKDGKWGVLKSDGTVVLEPKVVMDDYLIIDFIDSWHLYKDSSLELYVK